MKHHIFYINLIKSDILLEKLSTIYNDLSVKDLLTEDTCIKICFPEIVFIVLGANQNSWMLSSAILKKKG